MPAATLDGKKAWAATLFTMFATALDDFETYSRRVDAWMRADVDTLSTIANESAAAYPDVYREIDTERNVKWAERVNEMLASDEVELA